MGKCKLVPANCRSKVTKSGISLLSEARMKNKNIIAVIGTRPEAIKMAPVIQEIKNSDWARCRVLATAQHREMLDQVLELFGIVPDIDLNVMQPNQTLPALTARLVNELDRCFLDERPDAVLVQGDTTTVMVAALIAFYHKIPFGHVEAGLRTGDLYSPFPEEMNRVLAGHLARWHFAPTTSSRNSLLAEGIKGDAVYVTGNTVIDALMDVSERCDEYAPQLTSGKRLILVTAHRRENFGEPFLEICRAIKYLADIRNDIEFLYPVHPNPNIKKVAIEMLGGHPQIRLCDPLDYLPFVAAMKAAHLILTDSGGVQEEAPALGKPVLVLRNETERPEAVQAGVVNLIGPNFDSIVQESQNLLDNKEAYQKMAQGISPYGDGKAAKRIVGILKKKLCV